MRWLTRTGLGALALALLMGTYPLDEGEYHCEEAVKRLADCCPGHDYSFLSCYAGRGCDSNRPDIDDPKATEVRDTSCRDIQALGWCDTPPRTDQPDLATQQDLVSPPVRDLSVAPDLSRPDLAEED